jgi:uncharacterized protein with beta-barrel porin domain
MSVDRRSVLKGMALGSVAGPFMIGSLPAWAGVAGASAQRAPGPIVTLVSPGAADSAFVQGARAAVVGSPLHVRQVSGEVGELLEFERQLLRGQLKHVVGLLDDASATLVIDLARSAGARVHGLGLHTAEAGVSRHRLLNTDMAEGCVRELSRQLHACGAGFTLNEERQNSTAAARRLAGPPRSSAHSDQWAASIGYLLGSLGTRRLAMAPLVPVSKTPLTGSFVSFSIEARRI